MSAEQRAQESAQVCQRVMAYLKKQGLGAEATLALYSAFGTELSLDDLLFDAEAAGWQLAMPCMIVGNAGAQMEFVRVGAVHAQQRSLEFLAKPARALSPDALQYYNVVDPQEIDVMLVPVVAIDAHNIRLGYGGGNYDRYLPKLKPNCIVVAVAFDEQRTEKVPHDEHDCAVPVLITASGILHRK